MPPDQVVEAAGPLGTAYEFAVPASDTNPTNPAVSCDPEPGTVFPFGTTEVSCSAIDLAGNTGRARFSVTVQDTLPPAIVGTPQATVEEAQGPSGAVVTYTAPAASDIVDGERPVSCLPVSGATFALGTTTVVCTASDTRGNAATSTFDVTVSDTTRPVLVVPSPISKEATKPEGADVTFVATASDIVSGDLQVTCTPPSGSTFALRETEVTCQASDGAGNRAEDTFAVIVTDTTPPAVTVVPDKTIVEATGFDGAAISYTATATDLVDGALATVCSMPSGAMSARGQHLITCTATDSHGNTGGGSTTVTVVDTTAPRIFIPADQTLEATGRAGAVANFAASGTDVADPNPTVTCDQTSGASFPIGTTTVECTVTDASDNKATGSFTIKVVDTTAPTLKLPESVEIEATDTAGAKVDFVATAEDIVDGGVAVTCDPASGAKLALGTHTIACTAIDAHDNAAQGSFQVIVQDTTDPVLVVSGDQLAEATGPNGAAVSFTSEATDAVDADPDIECDARSGDTFPLGITEVRCTATDESGNVDRASFIVKVSDTKEPALQVPDDQEVEATGPEGAAVTFIATASDIADTNPSVVCTPPSGTVFGLGGDTVSCTATDVTGNSSTLTFNVSVKDTTKPKLSGLADQTIDATSPDGAEARFAITATDAVDRDPSVSCSWLSGATFPLGVTTVSCEATDDEGNGAEASFTITVVDRDAPNLVVPDELTEEATDPTGAVVRFNVRANDAIDLNPSVTCDRASGSLFPVGTTKVTCSATDSSLNSVTERFTITVVDTTEPRINVPASFSVDPTGPNGALVTYSATASDLVDGAITPICNRDSGSTFPFGTTTVTCKATDGAGNLGVASFTVTVRSLSLRGFLPPVEMGGVVNTVKAGSTVPLKFEVFAGATEVTSITVVRSFVANSIPCTNAAAGNPEELANTGGTTLRYDPTGGQFIQNWKTPTQVGNCYRVTLTTADKGTLIAFFKLK